MRARESFSSSTVHLRDMSLALETELRAAARRVGLLNRNRKTQVDRGEGYEAAVSTALLEAVAPGDTVWDVGANVGTYTALLADAVGPEGRVIAFEPVDGPFARLREKAERLPNVRTVKTALGDEDGSTEFHLSSDPEGGTHSVFSGPDSLTTVTVPVSTGDSLRRSLDLPSPQVLKIDVEGFELEVLRGLDECLRETACRAIFVEVHFRTLDRTRRRQNPFRIVRLLRGYGFRIEWFDWSHCAAYRRAAPI